MRALEKAQAQEKATEMVYFLKSLEGKSISMNKEQNSINPEEVKSDFQSYCIIRFK